MAGISVLGAGGWGRGLVYAALADAADVPAPFAGVFLPAVPDVAVVPGFAYVHALFVGVVVGLVGSDAGPACEAEGAGDGAGRVEFGDAFCCEAQVALVALSLLLLQAPLLEGGPVCLA